MTPEKMNFGKDHAAAYDRLNEKISELNNTLHLLTRSLLSDLPGNANILCVGAGTGAELLYLAKEFPGWHFTAVEPAEAMINRCRQKAADSGIESRCTFHNGYIDTLPESAPFNAATCFLVSQFIKQKDERINFFRQIAQRLTAGGMLISSDLSQDTNTSEYEQLLSLWINLLKYAGWPAETISNLPGVYKNNVAVLPPAEVEQILKAAGFNTPVRFFQAGLIHAWFAKR
jgi:tRNA (cmo5U34)-methyltransferase